MNNIHTMVATHLYNCKPENVTPDMQRLAKATIFKSCYYLYNTYTTDDDVVAAQKLARSITDIVDMYLKSSIN